MGPDGSARPPHHDRPATCGVRSPELRALLTEVDLLRLSLQTDLSLAAAALDAGADHLVAELLDTDRAELAQFEATALRMLRDAAPGAAVTEPAAPTRRTPLPRTSVQVRAACVLAASVVTATLLSPVAGPATRGALGLDLRGRGVPALAVPAVAPAARGLGLAEVAALEDRLSRSLPLPADGGGTARADRDPDVPDHASADVARRS